MASIVKTIFIDAEPGQVWAAISDFSAVHERAARGFVLATEMDGDARILTFANGLVAREQLVGVDRELRRIAYSTSSPRLTHHNASLQVFEDGRGRSRVVWTTDVLPETVLGTFETMLDHGSAAMKATIEASVANGSPALENRGEPPVRELGSAVSRAAMRAMGQLASPMGLCTLLGPSI